MLSLAASVVTSAACAHDSGCAYCEEGTAVPQTLRDSCVVPCGAGHVRLGLTVTLPDDVAASPSGREPPYPLVVFINGFQARRSPGAAGWPVLLNTASVTQLLLFDNCFATACSPFASRLAPATMLPTPASWRRGAMQ